MKKISIMLLVAVVLCAVAVGCRKKTTPTPTPTPAMTTSPTTAPATPAAPESQAPETETPGTGEGGDIEGFEEGKTVDAATVTKVEETLKAKFPDAKIKSVTFETYESKQAYHVILETEVEGSKDYYVFADGTVTAAAATTAS